MGSVSDFWQKFILAIVPAAIASGTLFYAARTIAARQHHTSKWWELKVEAYSRIIEQLASVKYSLDLWLKESWGMTRLDDTISAELRQKHDRAKAELTQTLHTGAFIIDQSAVDAPPTP